MADAWPHTRAARRNTKAHTPSRDFRSTASKAERGHERVTEVVGNHATTALVEISRLVDYLKS